VLREGVKAAAPYASLAEAKAAGATVIAYGSFVNQVIQFVILAWVVFLMVKAINRMRRRQAPVVVVQQP
jgi:large conductance mechanosensitive channel